MFNDYIDLQRQNMIKDLMTLVSVPSIAAAPDDIFPFGKNVNDALSAVTDIAKRMGFNAKNMGNCAEITFGPSKGEKVYIAGHVDIVPPGDGWTSPPYELTIRDGKIVGDEDNRNDMAGAENVKGSDLGDRLDLKSAQL